jgi:hypothetical protein
MLVDHMNDASPLDGSHVHVVVPELMNGLGFCRVDSDILDGWAGAAPTCCHQLLAMTRHHHTQWLLWL